MKVAYIQSPNGKEGKMKRWLAFALSLLFPVGAVVAFLGLNVYAAVKVGGEYRDYRSEIISRLWRPEERPTDVTSAEIAKRLKELDIDINK